MSRIVTYAIEACNPQATNPTMREWGTIQAHDGQLPIVTEAAARRCLERWQAKAVAWSSPLEGMQFRIRIDR